MNFGLRGGFSSVKAPRVAMGLNSPTSAFKTVNIGVNQASYRANPWDFVIFTSLTANAALALPIAASIGDRVRVLLEGPTITVAVNPGIGRLINGNATLTITADANVDADEAYVTFEYVGLNYWSIVSWFGNDLGLGLKLSGRFFAASNTNFINGAGFQGQKITNLANGTVSTDAVAFGQLSNGQIQGQILATKQYAPATVDTIALTSALTALDTTNLTLAFTVPASGIVDIVVNVYGSLTAGGSGTAVGFAGILNHSGGAQLGFTQPLSGSLVISTETVFNDQLKFHLTGLTPGALQVDFAATVTTSGGASGNVLVQGVTGNTSTGAPFVMQAVSSV